MPTTRKPIARYRKPRITPEAIEAYRRALKLHNDPKVDEWEEDGGCHREYLNACSDLQSLLGHDDSEAELLDTIGADEVPQSFLVWPDFAASWPKAVEIRQELERLRLAT
jgi:hypothetical protein